MEPKSIFLSKTFWTNIFAIGTSMILQLTGYDIPAEWTITALGVVNIILRLVTKQPVDWS